MTKGCRLTRQLLACLPHLLEELLLQCQRPAFMKLGLCGKVPYICSLQRHLQEFACTVRGF